MIRYTKTKEELAEIGIDVVEAAKTEKRKVTRDDLRSGRVSIQDIRQNKVEVID